MRKVKFTNIELQVIQCVCEEKTSTETAETIFRSKRTVDGIKSDIYKKIGCRNSVGIVKYAIKKKLFKI